MATKRGHSPELVPNPFIKKRNLQWSIDITGSPHDAASSSSSDEQEGPHPRRDEKPKASALEAGEASIDDHLSYFSELLAKVALTPFPSDTPHLPVGGYRKLYETNAGSLRGAHFIIHQHDHPINETSSASWAIMYGVPGDPNSFRLNRNATETRIHCLWNHLIETASHASGSLLIWDTGTYTVLPTGRKHSRADSQSSADEGTNTPELTEQEKLHQAFSARKIRLQLHGTRLPSPYVLNLRLTRDEDVAGRARSTRIPKTRRRRGAPSSLSSRTLRSSAKGKKAAGPTTSSDSESEHASSPSRGTSADQKLGRRTESHDDGDDTDIVLAPAEEMKEGENNISAMERELRELEDEEVRRTNAYPGATNSIGSVHQRRWYLSLDREASGFVKRRRDGRVVWERADSYLAAASGRHRSYAENDEKEKKVDRNEDVSCRLTWPFYVRGVEVERSVVTGRLGSEVLRDEGVVGFIGRKGWQGVLK
ncbi:DNA polymerase ligase-domain-containing protein [Xylariaceae sp. FL1651]|nr:DNA polymerase ligase-domain-containing protein [Xylariaceae sp. FL1651]